MFWVQNIFLKSKWVKKFNSVESFLNYNFYLVFCPFHRGSFLIWCYFCPPKIQTLSWNISILFQTRIMTNFSLYQFNLVEKWESKIYKYFLWTFFKFLKNAISKKDSTEFSQILQEVFWVYTDYIFIEIGSGWDWRTLCPVWGQLCNMI